MCSKKCAKPDLPSLDLVAAAGAHDRVVGHDAGALHRDENTVKAVGQRVLLIGVGKTRRAAAPKPRRRRSGSAPARAAVSRGGRRMGIAEQTRGGRGVKPRAAGQRFSASRAWSCGEAVALGGERAFWARMSSTRCRARGSGPRPRRRRAGHGSTASTSPPDATEPQRRSSAGAAQFGPRRSTYHEGPRRRELAPGMAQ